MDSGDARRETTELDIARRLNGLTVRRTGLALGLWGEAGIGKSYTAQALLRGVSCRSVTVHATQPLTAVVLALPRPKKPSAWLEGTLERVRAGVTLSPTEGPVLLSALLARSAPFVLHVEDLHEASSERLDGWTRLAPVAARTRGVGLLVTSRIQPPEDFEAVRLSALDRPGSDALLEVEAGATLPTEALAWLHGHAAGNPLFTLEYFRLLARQGSLWNDGRQWRWRSPRREIIPVTVEAVIERALQDAVGSPELRQVLEARAVLGSEVAEAVWAEVAGVSVDELNVARAGLARQGVLSKIGFAHPLYGEVTLRQLPAGRRQVLARRALEAFQTNPARAAEFVADANLDAAVALDWFERAAAAATSEVQAARFQGQAVDYARGERRATLATLAASGLRKVDIPEALRFAELAHQTAPCLEAAIMLRAELTALQGQLVEAEHLLEELGPRDSDHWNKARFLLRSGAQDLAGAFELWQSCPQLRSDDDLAVLHAALPVLLGLRHLTEGQAVLTRALGRDDLSQADRYAFEHRQTSVLLMTNKPEQAAALLSTLIPQVLEHTDLRLRASVLHNQGAALERLGQLQSAVPFLRQACDLYLQIGDVRAWARSRVATAWNLWHLAEYEEAEALLLESRAVLRRSDFSDTLVTCEGTLCLMYLDWVTPLSADLANKHAGAALDIARSLRNSYEIVASMHDLAVVKIRQGRAEEALQLADEMERLRQTHGLESMAANALYCRALALEVQGQHDQALNLMLEAETINEHLGGQVFTHKIGIEVARLSNDLECARRHLHWFEFKGMVNNVNTIIRYFPELAGPEQPLLMPEPTTRLDLLGDLRYSDGDPPRPIRGRKRQELLALLANARLSGRAEVPRPDMLDALYPDAQEPQANAALRDLVHQVRLDLGAGVIQTTLGGYALGDLRLDAEEFLTTGDTRLWRGPYLAGLGLEAGEESVRDALYLALRARAGALLHTDAAEVVRIGRVLLEADPYDLVALHLTLTALRAAQNHKSLGRVYEQARLRLLEVGEHLPVRWSDFLAQRGTSNALH